jgi:hypothetical protein
LIAPADAELVPRPDKRAHEKAEATTDDAQELGRLRALAVQGPVRRGDALSLSLQHPRKKALPTPGMGRKRAATAFARLIPARDLAVSVTAPAVSRLLSMPAAPNPKGKSRLLANYTRRRLQSLFGETNIRLHNDRAVFAFDGGRGPHSNLLVLERNRHVRHHDLKRKVGNLL